MVYRDAIANARAVANARRLAAPGWVATAYVLALSYSA